MKIRYNIILTFLLILAHYSSVPAQNLVTNPGFESYSSIPTGPAQWSYCNGWKSVNNIIPSIFPAGSPDYFHTSAVGLMNLPNSVYGTISPHSGNAIMGITVGMEFLPDNNEYIDRQLSSPLTIGNVYEVSFWIGSATKAGTGDWGMNKIGVHLSVGALTQTGHELISVTPQWISSFVLHGSNWEYVTFQFTATTAANWITIGHFDTDANTTFQLFGAPAPLFRAVNYFFDDISVVETSALPIELISFNAERDKNEVNLNWTTVSEINNDFFTIERSNDTETWEELGDIIGAGTTNEKLHYNFVDENPSTLKVSYYRLLQYDFNGKVSYSETKAVTSFQQESDGLITHYSPIDKNITIEYSSSSRSNIIIHIFNSSGKQIKFLERNIEKGSNSINLSCSEFTTGIFFIRVIIPEKNRLSSSTVSIY